MESQSFRSMPFEDVVLIVKGQFGTAHYALIKEHVEPLWRTSNSMSELLNDLHERLQLCLGPATVDPAHQALIDKRFRTLVRNELVKKFGAELDLIANLDDMINEGSNLREILMKVQFEISRKKFKR